MTTEKIAYRKLLHVCRLSAEVAAELDALALPEATAAADRLSPLAHDLGEYARRQLARLTIVDAGGNDM